MFLGWVGWGGARGLLYVGIFGCLCFILQAVHSTKVIRQMSVVPDVDLHWLIVHSYAVVGGSSQSDRSCKVCFRDSVILAYLSHSDNMTLFQLRSQYPHFKPRLTPIGLRTTTAHCVRVSG